MIRTLGVIAASAALVCAVCVGAAVIITGPDAIAHGAWSKSFQWRPGSGFGWTVSDDPPGPASVRETSWTGATSLVIDLPADVRYLQSSGPSGVRISGPKGVLDHVVIENGRISLQGVHTYHGDIAVVVTAPAVNAFTLDGSGTLNIENYQQDSLKLTIEGSGDVTAKGSARNAEVNIEGSGDADLGDLHVADARVRVDGSGDVRIAPVASATVNIAGSGDVDLLTDPPQLDTNISGSGDVRRHGKG